MKKITFNINFITDFYFLITVNYTNILILIYTETLLNFKRKNESNSKPFTKSLLYKNNNSR